MSRTNKKRPGAAATNIAGDFVAGPLIPQSTARRSSSANRDSRNSDGTPKPVSSLRPSSEGLSTKVTPATDADASPDGVECIDLTQTNVSDFFRLGTVRKELEPSSAKKRAAEKKQKKRGGLKTTGLENIPAEEIIIIDSSDEEDNDNDDVTVPIPYDDDDDDCAIIEVDKATPAAETDNSRPAKRAKVKNEQDAMLSTSKTKPTDTPMDEEGIEIVEATAPVLAAATTVPEAAATSVDDDVVVQGVVNETRLPHMRQHCTRFPFTEKSFWSGGFRINEKNNQSCDLCYCYVCDCPVSECKNWFSKKSHAPQHNHCSASDKDGSWKRMRSEQKQKKENRTTSGSSNGRTGGTNSATNSASISATSSAPLSGTDDAPPPGYHFMCDCPDASDHAFPWGRDFFACQSCWCYLCDKPGRQCDRPHAHEIAHPDDEDCRKERQKRKSSTFGLPGPFQPDHPDAHLNSDLTKCRHCSWFVTLRGTCFTPTSFDWCAVCGRVAAETDLGKQQETYKNMTDEKGSCFVGEKEIPFRIQAHDPRLFDKYKANWDDNTGWQYNEAEREEEVFLHRIGKSPHPSNILDAIPRVPNEKIPNTSDAVNFLCEQNLHDTTDAIIIEDPKQLELVLTIVSLLRVHQSEAKEFLGITASWNKDSRCGVFKFRLTIPKKAFVEHGTYRHIHSQKLLTLFGNWFGLFPLKPSEICGVLDVRSSEETLDLLGNINDYETFSVAVEPYEVELEDVMFDHHENLSAHIKSLSDSREANSSSLTLEPSQGSRRSWSVYSTASNSLRDNAVRYFSEHFVGYFFKYPNPRDFVASLVGQTRRDRYCNLDAILGFQTAVAAEFCCKEKTSSDDWESPSINNIMIEVENLGHESDDCVEGLQIELLEFQRQSLKWALEREKAPGGVQSFFWSKLPVTGNGNADIHFNPLLGLFRNDKPALVRGGFIAEQMGLGKTVISLALILKNPAPESPLSGSPVSELEKTDANNGESESCGWDKNLHGKTSTANKKTGSIISRGTLVICPVSLVGQWIDEARSKLKEPGLIYPYHGQNRNRNPNILASNSIVVTTYDILASDAFRKTKNSNVQDYCPPLQQVRWWRIICDEGHLLRESNTRRSKAVCSLVADHKWIVTGTPMNTSHSDLKNQLKFLGFEHVDRMFQMIGSGSLRNVDMSHLLYLLRPIMMRHSQEQKYRGTSTTLMSLPPKTVRKKYIKFSEAERKAFDKIEKAAQDWYINFRSANRSDISRHFLKISSKLGPLRIACSGGKCPSNSEKIYLDDDDNAGTDTMVAGTSGGAEDNAMDSNFVFESKFKTLIAKLKKIRDKEPDSKSLVFSQFSSTLDWLKIELPKHGFQFRTISGDMSMKKRAKALSDFQNDPPTTVFLLSMRSGAVGINLTQANRVFLMEPCFNPALEAQAIGRIHRLGQKRPVEILRLIVKDSFEERMVKFLEQKYGKDTSEKSDNKDDSNDKKVTTQAGNLNADKVKLVTEEFDILFGVKDRLPKDDSNEDAYEEGVDGIMADGVVSMGNV